MPRLLKRFLSAVLVALLALVSLWTFGAIFYDAPFPGVGNLVLALIWVGLLGFAICRWRRRRARLLAWLTLFLIVFIPWLFKKPSDHRHWSPEFARTPSVAIEGDVVTFTNFRNFDYHPDGTPIERWETRSVHLSKLRHMDFFLTYWGSTLVGHPVFSFDFGDEGHIAFSIESRREKGEIYGLISSLYKQFELIYVVAPESDIMRSRTNFRKGEEVYLYRLHIKETTARLRFSEYLDSINRFHEKPAWYNVITSNCTTAVRGQFTTAERNTRDWRIIFNGKLDELINERGIFYNKVPFAELKRRSHINPAAQANPAAETFSDVIRQGRLGFE